MYYPYLRGKQFELIALREFSSQNRGNDKIVPIIEPVKTTFNGLINAVEVLLENTCRFAIVLNSKEGDFAREGKDILLEVPILLNCLKSWIPAFIYRDNSDDILFYVSQNKLKGAMVIFKYEVEMNDSLSMLLSSSNVKYVVNGTPNSRLFTSKLKKMGKCMVRLDDCFVERKRNVDYVNCIEEKFTEEHLYYIEDGYAGISDYTVLPKDYVDGGMLPYAIAIHLTYRKPSGEIFVHHFVSDTNDDATNVQKKFFEASTKVKKFFVDKDKTPAINDLIALLDEGKYPGLGSLKKLSIKNHIELMNQILHG